MIWYPDSRGVDFGVQGRRLCVSKLGLITWVLGAVGITSGQQGIDLERTRIRDIKGCALKLYSSSDNYMQRS